MLRRSLDRDNKLEAKRLAQRNNTSFVFGSSTPRTLDLDLPALGCGRSQTMLFATPNRQSDENQSSRRRPVSAYYSDDFNISNSYDKPDTDTTFPLTTTADMSRDNYRYRSALYSEQARACLTMTSDSHSGHDLNVTNGSFSSAAGESA
ncbi:unnamed protein product [Oppiella nova]|uniref:Uncharacterized protein n=1 Tax=Oppiella nova TaxID=334625 RepID=A0A7R9MNY1_9ACAR|nr:unnamed protein product [Oppiella nova]CAG2180954.1 unnamed protein product [Oppiella nova]